MIVLGASGARAVDQNANQQSDVWEMLFQSFGLSAAGDFDADGFSDATGSRGSTDPRDRLSFPQVSLRSVNHLPIIFWQSLRGKRYAVLSSINLSSFTSTGNIAIGSGGE